MHIEYSKDHILLAQALMRRYADSVMIPFVFKPSLPEGAADHGR